VAKPPGDLLFRDAEVVGRGVVDVHVAGRIVSVRPSGASIGGDVDIIDCNGAALLPGLHDHHIHLLAAAAATDSVQCGRPEVTNRAELRAALTRAEVTDGWVRGVGYDEAIAGELDARSLDELSGPDPTRVQHRSGALWVVNTAGANLLGLESAPPLGIERDGAGRPTGRLWRLDGWLREQLGPPRMPDLGRLSTQLASYGVVGVTDATPDLTSSAGAALVNGVLQRLTLLGADGPVSGTTRGPSKLVLADHDLPDWDTLRQQISAVRPRPVALHAVTRASLVLAIAVLEELGVVRGDRIEHAAVAPRESVQRLAALGITVITQPSFVRERGADYLDRVDADDVNLLWPLRSLLNAGVPVGLSSDAPYGRLDPWAAIDAAVHRRTIDGRLVGAHERVTAWTALRGYLTSSTDPGGPERKVAPGADADLALLDRPLAAALDDPADVRVRLSTIEGRPVPSHR
jgi:predicted amidohydrolase YtcJ